MLVTYRTTFSVFLMDSQQDTMHYANVLHVGELDCIRHRWAILGEPYFTGIIVEQLMIDHAEGPTI